MAKKPNSQGSGPSQRQLRVGELIRHALAEMLARGDIHDDVLAKHVVTVPEVRLSPDLKLATCYIMPLGGQDVAPVLKALDANKRHIRGEVAHRVNLKYAPDLRFRQDESFDEAARIDALLDSEAVRRDTDRKPLRIDQALHRSLAHAAYHIGQVVYLAKLWAGDRWDSLSIPMGQSVAFNATLAASKAPYTATALHRK